MRLLIITQKVDSNDSVLGFMVDWIKEFSKYCQKLTVICLQKGEYNFPANVKILSLGKEIAQSKIKYIINFYKYIWQERKNYDIVFTHMNPEYIVLGGLLWKIWGKKIALWYTHKRVDLKLRLAEKLANIVFTASAKSFRLKSKKINIMGHGINTELFIPALEPVKEKIILNVDRISPTKNQLVMIKIFKDIKEKIGDCQLYLVGAPVREADENYFNTLKEYVKNNNLIKQVKFFGAIANKNTPDLYRQAKVSVNFSATGSLDKTILEAMACDLPVVTTNEAFKHIVPAENYSQDFMNAKEKIIYFLQQDNRQNYRDIIIRDHSLNNLIANIIKKLI